MEPRIQYAKTADGVSIAFWTLGEGMPLVCAHGMGISHIEMEWQWPELRAFYERLAQKRKLIRYDPRGMGLSDRRLPDYSLDSLVLDLEAVVNRLGLERLALFANVNLGPAAIAYAARHPERISHLLLWSTYARYSEFSRSPQVEATRSLIDRDWNLYTETIAHAMVGWSKPEAARRFAALMRESMTQEVCRAALQATRALDVAHLLSEIRSPTLVLHRREYSLLDIDAARGLASRIPNARLALLEGTSVMPILDDADAALAAIDEFLSEAEEAVAAPGLAREDIHTILFTDMESSSALRRRLGDAKAQELVRIHNSIVRDALSAHGGSEIKHTGDGIMASFPTASGALECAVAIQRGVAAHVEQHPDAPLGVYIGLNAGEPISEEKDLFGTSVDLARRICDNAQPGQILASDLVAGLAAGKGFVFEDQGEASLKGFERPVRLYEVRWREEE